MVVLSEIGELESDEPIEESFEELNCSYSSPPTTYSPPWGPANFPDFTPSPTYSPPWGPTSFNGLEGDALNVNNGLGSVLDVITGLEGSTMKWEYDEALNVNKLEHQHEDIIDQLVVEFKRVDHSVIGYRDDELDVISGGGVSIMNGVEHSRGQALSTTPEPSLVFQEKLSVRVWLGHRGQWVADIRYGWNWLNLGTFRTAEGAPLASESVKRLRGGKDLFDYPQPFLIENGSEPLQLPPTAQEENQDDGIDSEGTGDCAMADQARFNFGCLEKGERRGKNPRGERRNKKANGVRIAIPLFDILQTKGMCLKDAANHLKVSISKLKSSCWEYGIPRWPPLNEHKLIRQSLSKETLAVVDQMGIPQLTSHTVPSNQALTATVDTNSVVEKEIPPPQFLPTAQQGNFDAGFGNDEAEAIGVGVEGTWEAVMEKAQLNSGGFGNDDAETIGVGIEGTWEAIMEEAQLNSGCLGKKGKRKVNTPGGERGNNRTTGVRIAIPKEDILQTKGMRLIDAAKHLEVSITKLKSSCQYYGIPKWPPRINEHKLIQQSFPKETPGVVDQEGIPQLTSHIVPSNQALTATVDTNNVVEKEIPPSQFLPTAQQENPDAGFGNDEAEAIGVGVEGTWEAGIEEVQLNSRCLGKKEKMNYPGGERGNNRTGVRIAIPKEDILQTMEMRLIDAAKHLKVSKSTLKRICREYGIYRWPPRKEQELISQSRPNKSPAVVDPEQIPQLNPDMLLPSNQVPATSDTYSVKVKVRCEEGTIMFRLSCPWRKVELEQEVKKRLSFEAGTYNINYKDEDEELILINCDEDLKECISRSSAGGSRLIELFLKLMGDHSARTCHFRNTEVSGFTVPRPGFGASSMFPSPGFYSSSGFQSINLLRPDYTTQFSVQMPFAQMTSQVPSGPHFMTAGHNTTGGYGAGYNNQFPFGTSSGIQHHGYPIGPSSGIQGNGFPTGPSSASAFTECYAPGSGHVTTGHTGSVSPSWYLDSGATNHVTSDLNNLTNPQPYLAGAGVESVSPSWYLDSGATNHVTSDLNNLTNPQPYPAGAGVGFVSPSWYLDSGATNHVTSDLNNLTNPLPYPAGAGVGSVSPSWYLDSGATNHITSYLNNLTNPQPYPAGAGVMVGNGQPITPSPLQGAVPQGPLSYSELL